MTLLQTFNIQLISTYDSIKFANSKHFRQSNMHHVPSSLESSLAHSLAPFQVKTSLLHTQTNTAVTDMHICHERVHWFYANYAYHSPITVTVIVTNFTVSKSELSKAIILLPFATPSRSRGRGWARDLAPHIPPSGGSWTRCPPWGLSWWVWRSSCRDVALCCLAAAGVSPRRTSNVRMLWLLTSLTARR